MGYSNLKDRLISPLHPMHRLTSALTIALVLTVALFWASRAEASLLIRPPLYLGLSSGLIGDWSFDQADIAGTVAYDRSGQGNNGTLTGGAATTIGRIGQGLAMQSSMSQYMDAGDINAIDGISKMSVSAWIKPTSLNDAETMIGKYNDGALTGWRISAKEAELDTIVVAGAASSTFGAVTSVTISNFQVSSGSNRYLLVSVALDTPAGNVTSVTYNGANFTLISRVAATQAQVEIWGLAAPDVTTANVVVTLAGAPAVGGIAGVMSFTGVSQSDPYGTVVSDIVANTTPSVDVTSATGELVFDTIALHGPSSLTVGAGQTLKWRDATSLTGGASTEPGAGTVTMSWSIAGTSKRSLVALPIKPATLASDDAMIRFSSATAQTTGAAFKKGQWSHMLMLYDGTQSSNADKLKVYINGVQQTLAFFGTIPTTVPDTTYAFRIGAAADNTDYFSGTVDDVRIYNRTLSDQEIKRLYNIGGTLHLAASMNQKITNGLVGLWSFDQNDIAGTVAYDRSGQGNNGTLTGGAATTIGRIGQGLNFNGSTQYVDVIDTANLRPGNGSWSYSAWTKVTASNAERMIINKLGGSPFAGYDMQIGHGGTSGKVLCEYNQSYPGTIRISESNTSVADGQWHFLVCVADKNADTVRIYNNGVEMAVTPNNAGSWPNISDTSNLNFGRYAAGNSDYYDAPIDDIRIYNRALSAQEVKRLYNMGGTLHLAASQNQKLTNGLVGLWSFDAMDMGTTSATDMSGNNNRGYFINGPAKTIGKIGQGLSFDGVDDYVDGGDQASHRPSDAVSLCAWMKYSSETAKNSPALISKEFTQGVNPYVSYDLTAGGDGGGVSDYKPHMIVDVSGTFREVASATVLSRSTWYHLCGTWSSGDFIKLYINGALDSLSAAAYSGTISYNAGKNLFVGREAAYAGSASYFKGTIDDVRIYNRALSVQEVQRLYNMGHTGS